MKPHVHSNCTLGSKEDYDNHMKPLFNLSFPKLIDHRTLFYSIKHFGNKVIYTNHDNDYIPKQNYQNLILTRYIPCNRSHYLIELLIS